MFSLSITNIIHFLRNLILTGCLLFAGYCQGQKKPSALKVSVSYQYQQGVLEISLGNPLEVPVRFGMRSEDAMIDSLLARLGTVLLAEQRDSLIRIELPRISGKPLIRFKTLFGDLSRQITAQPFSLPFPLGRSYRVVQGNFGSFSHQDSTSRYALDFALATGDTVCAADAGVVVKIVDSNQLGGKDMKYFDYANYLTLYHPLSGLFTQYVHLGYKGVLVKLGERVVKGQAIGRSGMTGYTAGPHLHFNVFKPVESGWISIPVTFSGGYSGPRLKTGQWVRRRE